ncbi:germinal-center associated nuclear protein-like [Ornithodoros turicata]|uniref:germinal-center associated nuclear protein-like n=1 Tax=Ornithodoros turicata TaxID=34597 RepID=UPI003138B3F5
MFRGEGDPPAPKDAPHPPTANVFGVLQAKSPVFQSIAHGTSAAKNISSPFGIQSSQMQSQQNPYASPATAFGHQPHLEKTVGNTNLFERLGTPTALPQLTAGATQPTKQCASPPFSFGLKQEFVTPKATVSATAATAPFPKSLVHAGAFGTPPAAPKCEAAKQPLFGSVSSPLKAFGFSVGKQEPGRPSLFGNAPQCQQGGFSARQQIGATVPVPDSGTKLCGLHANQERKVAFVPGLSQQQQRSLGEQASIFDAKSRESDKVKSDTGFSSPFSTANVAKPSIFGASSAHQQGAQGFATLGAAVSHPERSVFGNVKFSVPVFSIRTGGKLVTDAHGTHVATSEPPVPPLFTDKQKYREPGTGTPTDEPGRRKSPANPHATRSESRSLESSHRRSSHSSRSLLARALAGVEGEKKMGNKVVATPEEISTLVTLMCTNIPAEHNDRETLLEHFSQFGPIERITCQPRKGCASVKFRDHQTAELAKKHGARLSTSCPPLEIFWCSSRKLSTEGAKHPSSGSTDRDQEESDITEPKILPRPEEAPPKHPSLVRRVSESARSTSLLAKLTKPKLASAKALLQRKTAAERDTVDATKCATQAQDEAHLMAELRRTAHTVGERFRTLDVRDKIIRLHLQKQSDIVTAKATRGSCPDMCPEKERYSRTDKKCLSSFEVLPGSDGVMDPRRMVKEYSRSSADQEEPLPHELRPPSVLSLTMDYLMCNIMDIQESVPVGEWYDFIWNRTRAIRKDITQQHLCDLISVSLVEKCARFHIHCAAVLIEEDMTTFDSKINDENLGKCLQTLKHLYYDISLRGVRCHNEAEFRAYDVLLHLNEGDIVWQVQQLPEDIRRSPEVSLSVAASEALNCHNYVRFFRVAAEAPYLSSCLLHRYFAQVRTQALQTMLKACRPTSHKEEIPLSTLVDQLKFDDAAEAQDFATCLGQAADEMFLYLDRSSQMQLERAPLREGGGNVIFSTRRGWEQKGRSKLLVENKRTCSIGEVVNGSPLPSDPLDSYIPHDSFMTDGTLRPAAYDAGDQVRKCWGESSSETPAQELQNTFAVTTAFESQPPSFAPPAPLYSNEAIKDVARDIINETIVDYAYSTGHEVILMEWSEHLARELLEEVTAVSARELSQEVYLYAKEQRLQEILIAKQLAREQAQEAERRCHAALVEEMTLEVVNEDLGSLCRSCHREALQELWDKQSEDIGSSLLSDAIASEVQDVAASVFTKERALYHMKLSRAHSYNNLRLLRTSFKRWLEYKNEQKSQRVARETFPAIPNLFFNLSDPELRICPKRQRVMLGEHRRVEKCLDVAVTLKVLHDELEWAPMDISRVLRKTRGTFQFPFKLLVSLPSRKQRELDDLSAKVMKKLGFSRHQVSLSHEKVTTYINSEEANVPFCITAVNCTPPDMPLDHLGRPQALLGTSAVLFIATPQFEDSVPRRLKELAVSISKLDPVPPVCLLDISQEKSTSSAAMKAFALDWLQQLLFPPEKLLVLGPHSAEERGFRHLIEEALEWCAAARSNVPGLCSDYLKDFAEKALVELSFDVIYGDIIAMQNNPQFPHLVLKLYNNAVEHLAHVLASESLARLTVAPPELNLSCYNVHWNDPSYLLRLHDVVLSLCLPPIHGDPYEVDTVWEYIKHLCKATRCQHSATVLMASTQEALKSHGGPKQKQIPWASIIHDCHCHILRSTNFFDPSTGKEYIAHYMEDELYSFSVPQFWNDALHWASPVGKTTLSIPVSDSKECSPMQATSYGRGADAVTLDQLDAFLKRQKAESMSFTSHLAKLVSESPLDGSYCESMVPVEMSWSTCDDDRSDAENLLNLADAVDALNTRVQSSKMTNRTMTKILELVLGSGDA